MWIAITEPSFKGGVALTAPELNLARTTLLPSGVTDRLTDAIANVTNEVRGYCSSPKARRAGAPPLGPEGTIPDELLTAAISRITYELCRALPGKVMLTDQRTTANENALALLERVADGAFGIAPPETEAPAAEQPAPAGRGRWGSATQFATR